MKPAVRVKARVYMEALLKHETILIAQSFLRVFVQITPLSKYLQTSGMDNQVTRTEDSLRKCSRDFAGDKRADVFVEWANGILQEQDDCDVEVQTALPDK